MKAIKTNAMRLLDAAGISYDTKQFRVKGAPPDGLSMARMLGEDPACVFKTLVTVGDSGEHYVFMVPVTGELSLKKAASLAQEKKVEMVKSKDLMKLTGYVHGGCSPLAMKKDFPCFIDQSALQQAQILFSAGKIGVQIRMAPRELVDFRGIRPGDLAQ